MLVSKLSYWRPQTPTSGQYDGQTPALYWPFFVRTAPIPSGSAPATCAPLHDGAQEGMVDVERHGIAARHLEPVVTAAQFQVQRKRGAQLVPSRIPCPRLVSSETGATTSDKRTCMFQCGNGDGCIGAEQCGVDQAWTIRTVPMKGWCGGRFDLRAWNGGVGWGVGLTMPVSSRSKW